MLDPPTGLICWHHPFMCLSLCTFGAPLWEGLVPTKLLAPGPCVALAGCMGGMHGREGGRELKGSIAREGSNARKGRTGRRLNERAMRGEEGGRGGSRRWKVVNNCAHTLPVLVLCIYSTCRAFRHLEVFLSRCSFCQVFMCTRVCLPQGPLSLCVRSFL